MGKRELYMGYGPRDCTVRELRTDLAALLRSQQIPTAETEARDIVAAVLDVQPFWPTLHPTERLTSPIPERARRAVVMRIEGAPFAYATGRAAFRNFTLLVDQRVLIPRPETEQLVDVALAELAGREGGIAVDVGTGSGAIALSLASEARFERVIATDISTDALRVASANAKRLKRVLRTSPEFRQGTLLRPLADLAGRVRLLVSNPPYIAYDEARALPRSVRDWEPSIALFCGDGGMAATAEVLRGAAELLEPDGVLAVEADTRRAPLVAERLAADARYCGVSVRMDLTGRERFVVARRAG